MPVPDLAFDFAIAASRLAPEQQDALEAMKREHEKEKARFDADHSQNADAYRREEEKRLTEHLRHNHSLKPPPGVVRDVPSADQIRQRAADNVRSQYVKDRAAMVKQARDREVEFVRAALGIEKRPPRGLDQDLDRGR